MIAGFQFVRRYGCMTMIVPLLFAFGCGPARPRHRRSWMASGYR